MFDIVIIGAGTAGLSAAIYASRAGKSALVLEGKAYGGQIINTPDIENYPGIAHISGFDFATGLYNQAKALGAVVKMQQALRITKAGGRFLVETRRETHEAKAVILATGATNRPLGLEKEEALIGRGISYCATCDGMFYRGKTVAVNGGGNTAVEDAMFLTGYCEKVYLIHRRDAFRADEKEVERLREKENVEFVLDSVVEALEETDGRLSGIRVKNVKSGESSELPVGGLFIAIGQVPDNGAFQDLVDLDEKGYIIAGEDLKTKTEGVFTAGDCRTKEVRQLTTAASDGTVAALAASKYIDALT
jgi:thioredoxin reductase (NADPH)